MEKTRLLSQQMICFCALIRSDIHVFSRIFVDRLINLAIWAAAVVGISGYILPLFGATATYGAFIATGAIVSAGVFEGYGHVAELVTELSHDKPLLYQATLPISTELMTIRIMLSNSLRGFVLSCFVLPLGKLILGSGLDLSYMRLFPFCGMLVAAALFYGACSVWLACRVPSILGISNVWMRIVFPLWFLGGFQFSQGALLQVVPRFGMINFLNPMIYITEGMRAAVLGQAGFLNVWLCLVVILGFWLLFTWRGIVSLRARLDLI